MKARILAAVAVGVMSVTMLFLGSSPAMAGNGRGAQDSGWSQQNGQLGGGGQGWSHSDGSTTVIINNNQSLLSNIEVILDLLDLLGGGGNGGGIFSGIIGNR